jgi:hypothetical protein
MLPRCARRVQRLRQLAPVAGRACLGPAVRSIADVVSGGRAPVRDAGPRQAPPATNSQLRRRGRPGSAGGPPAVRALAEATSSGDEAARRAGEPPALPASLCCAPPAHGVFLGPATKPTSPSRRARRAARPPSAISLLGRCASSGRARPPSRAYFDGTGRSDRFASSSAGIGAGRVVRSCCRSASGLSSSRARAVRRVWNAARVHWPKMVWPPS